MSSESPRITELRRRVESDPSSIAFAQLAEEYRRAGNYEAAERWCRIGLQRHPAYLSARVTLGRTLLELNKLEEAEQELQHVLTAAPDNLAALRGVAEIHQRLEHQDSALEYYRRALALSRNDPELQEIVDRLTRPSGASPPASPASASPTDFDALLDSFGIDERTAPPVVEALLNPCAESAGPPVEAVDSAVFAFQSEATAEPEWMTGPLPDITMPGADQQTAIAPSAPAAPAPATPVGPGPAAPVAPGPAAPVAPGPAAPVTPGPAAPVAPAPTAPDAPAARTAPDAPTAPVAPVAPGEDDRLILAELEAWLEAIKR